METLDKPLSTKSKSKVFCGELSQQQQQSTSPVLKYAREQNPFPSMLLFQARDDRRIVSFIQTGPQFSGTPKRGNIFCHSRTPIANRIQSSTPPYRT